MSIIEKNITEEIFFPFANIFEKTYFNVKNKDAHSEELTESSFGRLEIMLEYFIDSLHKTHEFNNKGDVLKAVNEYLRLLHLLQKPQNKQFYEDKINFVNRVL